MLWTILESLSTYSYLKGVLEKGAGTCPVRGHSNVQGDRTMGIWEKPKDAFLDRLECAFDFKAPRAHGYDVVEAIKAMHQKKATIFFGMGGNFLSATPDTTYTAKALKNCSLTVHVSTKLNRSHLIHGKSSDPSLPRKIGERYSKNQEHSLSVLKILCSTPVLWSFNTFISAFAKRTCHHRQIGKSDPH